MEKIMTLIKNKDEEKADNSSNALKNNAELVNLLKDFHDQYQSLNARYNKAKVGSGKKPRSRKKREQITPYWSSSDEEYYSSKEVEAARSSGFSGNVFRESGTGELVELKQKLESATVERNMLKVEIDSLQAKKKVLEEQCENKAAEVTQLGEKNAGFSARISELEFVLKEKEDEIASLIMKLKDREENSTLRNDELMAQVSYLQQETDSLRAQKDDAIGQARRLSDQVGLMQHDLVSLTSQKTDLEILLQRKSQEAAEYANQLKNFQGEMSMKAAAEQRMLKEKEGYLVRIKDLELEMESLCTEKFKLEEDSKNRLLDNKLLKEENDRLKSRNRELEDELSNVCKEYEVQDSDFSSQIRALTAQIDHLQQELNFTQAQKSQLDLRVVRERQESSAKVISLEHENDGLTTMLADQHRMLKEQEDTIAKLREEAKESQRLFTGAKINIQISERKMSDLAEEYRKKLEDNIRVLYRRIRVAEQLHNENRDYLRVMKERFEEENKVLKVKVADSEAKSKHVEASFNPGNQALSALESAASKLDADGELMTRISNIANELVDAKNWVTDRNEEIRRLKQRNESLVSQLGCKEDKELLLRGKMLELENEKLTIMKSMSQLESKTDELEKHTKEKDDVLLSLGEEKREAIRQLCILIEYHRNDCDYLKGIISKMSVRRRH